MRVERAAVVFWGSKLVSRSCMLEAIYAVGEFGIAGRIQVKTQARPRGMVRDIGHTDCVGAELCGTLPLRLG